MQADAFLPHPVPRAGLVGMRTSRIKVGPALLAPLYHPIRLAGDAAVIDLATQPEALDDIRRFGEQVLPHL